MITPPNPLARLVGELPNLRERLAKATPGPWEFTEGAPVSCCREHMQMELAHATVVVHGDGYPGGRMDAALIAASPSAHAIAIEAIERLERVEKALMAIRDDVHPGGNAHEQCRKITDDALLGDGSYATRAALAAEPDRRKG